MVGSTATITNLLNMNPSVVGLYLNLETEGPPGNNGSFLITAYLSPTSVKISNPSATVQTSSYDWYLFDGLNAAIESLTGANGPGASISAFASPLATVVGLNNMDPTMVGQNLVLNNISLQGTGATITAFDGTNATIAGLFNMTSALVGQYLNISFGPNGTNASITAFDGTNATVVGLTGMNPAFVGTYLNLNGSLNGGNNGSFLISAYLSPTSVEITNPSAVSPDAGPLNWSADDPNNGNWQISSYISPTSVQITNPATVYPDSSQFTWSTTDPNDGSFPIAAYISPTSVQIVNPSAVSPDTGPFFWYVVGQSNNCALVVGLQVSPSIVGQTITISGTSQPGNSGTFLVVAYVSPESVWIHNPAAVTNDAGNVVSSGTSAYISSVVPGTDGGEEIISGLTGITPGLVGQAINVSNAFYAGSNPAPNNNGFQAILAFISPTALQILNDPYPNACFAPDYGVGGTALAPTINWSISQYVQIIAVQAFETVTGLSGISPSDVGLTLTIQGANSSPNQGVWEIAGYISATSVLLNNSSAVPDSNNYALGWYVGTNYDLSQITLASTPSNQNGAEFFIYDGVTFNKGIARIEDIEVYTEFNYQTYLGVFLKGSSPAWTITGTGELQADGNGFIYDFSQTTDIFANLTLTGNAYANNIVNFGTNQSAGITVYIYDASFADNHFAQGTEGNVEFLAYTPLSQSLPTSISGFTGSLYVNYASQAVTLGPYTNSGPPSFVTNSPIQIGTMYFDTNLNQAFWWTGSAWVSYAQLSYSTANVVQGHAAQQSSNLAAGDHVIFNIEDIATGGPNIQLDTSTPYTTTPGQPSVGRITLQQGPGAAGHLYKLVGNLNQVSGSGNIYFQWWYTNSVSPGGVAVGNGSRLDDGTNSGDFASHGDCVAYIYTNSGSGGTALAELRIMFNNGMTSIGENAAAPIYAWFTVEQIY